VKELLQRKSSKWIYSPFMRTFQLWIAMTDAPSTLLMGIVETSSSGRRMICATLALNVVHRSEICDPLSDQLICLCV